MKRLLQFIETSLFTKQIKSLITDDQYSQLQDSLMNEPEQGDIVIGTGGVRKTRFAIGNRGKSGGLRIIYFYVDSKGRIYMLLAYPKSKQTTLSDEEKSILLKLTTAIKENIQNEQ